MQINPAHLNIEGYLIYNEGKLTTKNVDNSGRIHFITDGNKVLFDNGYDYITVAPIIESGSLDFDIEIVRAYDYIINVFVVCTLNSFS